jgi:L-threonylcarbamoyladenylate synthase
MTIIPFGEILDPGNVKKIGDCLRADGVLAYPTDTLYGLGGSFFSLAAARKIDAMKGRSDQPYSAAVGSLAMLESLAADIPDVFRLRLQGLLPGKFTFLFMPSPRIAPELLKDSGKIGIRLPGLRPLLRLLRKIDLPVLSTSANRSGEPPLNDPRRIAREFPAIDLLLDGGELPASAGSTVVDLTVTPPRIVRPGDGHEEVRAALAGNARA